MGMDLILSESALHINISLENMINKSLELGVLSKTGRTLERRLCKNKGDNDDNNYRPISVTGLIESLVSYQIIDFWKNIPILFSPFTKAMSNSQDIVVYKHLRWRCHYLYIGNAKGWVGL